MFSFISPKSLIILKDVDKNCLPEDREFLLGEVPSDGVCSTD